MPNIFRKGTDIAMADYNQNAGKMHNLHEIARKFLEIVANFNSCSIKQIKIALTKKLGAD